MSDDVSHAELLQEMRALRDDLHPLLEEEFRADLKEVVGVLRAARIGGRGLNWIASIVKAVLLIGGVWLIMKAGLNSDLGG